MPTPLRTHIGKYEIISVLGKGGMGVVYRGLDTKLERYVAIKMVHPHLIEGEEGTEFSQRFIQEAKAIARCQHPNIVTMLEYGEDQGVPYMVMEYIEGQTLHDYINTNIIISLKSALKIILKVLKALSFAHSQGIIHRDIKPANILLRDDQVKLTDFGIARMPSSELTLVGSAIGTPYYMSPEQALGEMADARSDLFSVGVILTELLAQSPINHNSTTLSPIQGLPPKTRVNFSVYYPKNLLPVIYKSLHPDRTQRYQSAGEFAQAILEAIKTTNQPSSPPLNATAINHDDESKISQQHLTRLKQTLTPLVGPIADKLIRHEIAQQHDLQAMILNLSRHIPTALERNVFITEMTKPLAEPRRKNPGSATSTPSPMETKRAKSGADHCGNTDSNSGSANTSGLDTPAYVDMTMIKALCQSYSAFVGPLADRIVKRAMKKFTSNQQLIHYLAEQIPDAQERTQFLKQWYGYF